MAVSEHTIAHQHSAVDLMYAHIDWQSVIERYARQYDMSLREALRWLSNRSSLEVACEIIGIPLSPDVSMRYTAHDIQVLNQFGDFLSAHGYSVPRLLEYRKMEYSRWGRSEMGFSLTREEYLRERAAGKSKNRIAREQGISGPALFHWLNKWGLKGSAAERQEIEQMATSISEMPSGGVSVEFPQTVKGTEDMNVSRTEVSETADMTSAKDSVSETDTTIPEDSTQDCDGDNVEVEVSRPAGFNANIYALKTPRDSLSIPVTLNLPIATSHSPMFTKIDTTQLTRDEMLRVGVSLIQGAVNMAFSELVQLLGPEAAKSQIQQYVKHQLELQLDAQQ